MRMSQFTSLPRSTGPAAAELMAISRDRMPTPLVRTRNTSFSEMSRSYSSIKPGRALTSFLRAGMNSGGISWLRPPKRR